MSNLRKPQRLTESKYNKIRESGGILERILVSMPRWDYYCNFINAVARSEFHPDNHIWYGARDRYDQHILSLLSRIPDESYVGFILNYLVILGYADASELKSFPQISEPVSWMLIPGFPKKGDSRPC